MFLDPEEGSVPRKKLRIRNYPDNIVDYYLEKKLRVSKENLKLAKRKQKKKFLILRQMEFLDFHLWKLLPINKYLLFQESILR